MQGIYPQSRNFCNRLELDEAVLTSLKTCNLQRQWFSLQATKLPNLA